MTNETTGNITEFTAAFRVRSDVPRPTPAGPYKIEPRALYLESIGNYWRFSLGLQEVVWGEAFGLPVADIINPYDSTEDQLANRSASRIPVAMVNALVNAGPFSVQLIYTPQPRRSPSPQFPEGTRTEELPAYMFGRDAEYGGRIGFLHSSGFDLKPFYYAHWNRLPVYQVEVTPEGPTFVQVENLVHSYGLSFSQAFHAVVIRGDLAEHRDTPFFSSEQMKVIHYRQQQASLGGDYTTDSGNSTFGIQFQYEDGIPRPDYFDRKPFLYAAIRYQGSWFDDLISPELLVFQGIENEDLWVKVKLGLNITGSLNLSSEGDWVFSGEHGHPLYFIPQRRVYSAISYKF